MKLKPKYTHAEHVELAKRVCEMNDNMYELFYDLQERYGKSSRMCRKLNTAIKAFSLSVRSELDEEYHVVTSHAEFIKEGHVYYNSKR